MPSAFRPTRILTGMRAARKRRNRSAYRAPASFLGGNPSYRIWGSVNMEELYISISQTRSQPEFFISAGRGRQSQDTHRVRPLFQIPSAEGCFISGGRKQGEPESRYGKTYNRKHKTIRKMNRSKKNGRTIGAMALIASMIPVVLTAQARETGVDKTTWLYAVKGTDSLYMDRYVAEASRETNAPCLIFAFGGGFVGGERDNPAYVPYFEYFARKGYAVVSIDYRLGLRETAGSRPDPADTPEALAERFFAAVDMAVEDLYDATSFIVGQARAWGLDPSAVVASGSSAGAITVLQGEYERCTGSALSRRSLRQYRHGRHGPLRIALSEQAIPPDEHAVLFLFGQRRGSRDGRTADGPEPCRNRHFSRPAGARTGAIDDRDASRADRNSGHTEKDHAFGLHPSQLGSIGRIRSVSGRKTADSRPRTDCIDVRPAWSATKTYRDRSSLKTGNRLRPCRRQPGRTTPGIGDC